MGVKGHYEKLIAVGWLLFWAEMVQLFFWFGAGIYICAFTTEKFAVAHVLSALHFTGSLGLAEVTETLEQAQLKHDFPQHHFLRSWGFLFILTLLADVLLLLDVAVYLPRDDITPFAVEIFVGSWAMLTGLLIFIWALLVFIQTRRTSLELQEYAVDTLLHCEGIDKGMNEAFEATAVTVDHLGHLLEHPHAM